MSTPIIVDADDLRVLLEYASRTRLTPAINGVYDRLLRAVDHPPKRWTFGESGLGPSMQPRADGAFLRIEDYRDTNSRRMDSTDNPR